MKAFTSKIKVRYAETDQMGVVHHASYYPWFEVARTDFLEEMVANYKDIEAMGLLLPVAESHCNYKKAAKYGDEVTITTTIKTLNRVKMVVEYEVYRYDDLIATGYTSHAFVDKDFHIINIKKVFPDIYMKLEACL